MSSTRFNPTRYPSPRRLSARIVAGRPRAAALLAAGCLMAACGGSGPGADGAFGRTSSPPDQPGVRLTLQSPDGEAIDLEAMRGSRVLIFFFTTYDIASQVEMERLVVFAARHPDLEVVGVALQPNAATLLGLYRDYLEPPFPVAYDPTGQVQAGLSPLGMIGSVPSYILLDASGRVAGRHFGETTAEVLGPLLGGGPAPPPEKAK